MIVALCNQSLSNFQWVGPLLKVLQDLIWPEEQLIALSQIVGKIVHKVLEMLHPISQLKVL